MSVATKRTGQAGIREVKNHLSTYLGRVRNGEEIIITDRGRPVARITSVEPDVDRIHALVEQGVLIAATAPRSLPSRRVRAKGLIAQVVADERR